MYINEPIKNLYYFAEWGGRNWVNLLKFAINELQKDKCFDGADLLDIGTRYGKMAVLFALLGAQVKGIDIHEHPLNFAREEAIKWNVSNVIFSSYNGDLDMFPNESFDIIFTKSVLIVVPNLEDFLKKVSAKLRPNGRIIFLENGKGNVLCHILRAIKHREWDYHRANYFTYKEVKLIKSIFQVDSVRRTFFPPVYLILGRKMRQI